MAQPFIPLQAEAFPEAARPSIERLNQFLLELSRLEGTIRQPIQSRRSDATVARRDTVQVDVSRITPSISEVVSGVSTAVGTPSLTLGTVNTVGSTTTAVSINSAVAIFGTQAPAALATSAAIGSSAYAARADHAHEFGPTLQSTANDSTLTLTDYVTGQTLTGSLGLLGIAAADDELVLPSRISLGNAIRPDAACAFESTTSSNGTAMRVGLKGGMTANDGGTYTSEVFYGGVISVATTTGTTFTTCSSRVLEIQPTPTTFSTSLHSFTNRDGLFFNGTGLAFQSGSGGVTTTTVTRIRSTTWPVIGNPGTSPIAYECYFNMPTVGSSTRHGIHVATITGNIGTEPTNADAFYCEPIRRGTVQRTTYYAEGHATGTPTQVMSFYAAAHAVGSSRFSFYGVSDTLYQGGKAEIIGTLGVTGIATLGNSVTIAGTLDHNGARVGLYGATPTVQFGTTGTVNGFAAGTSTALTVDSTFTGDTGTLAYTLGDCIRALKLLGGLAY